MTSRTNRSLGIAALACLLLIGAPACGGDDGADRGQVVASLADDVAVPMYRDLADRSSGLRDSVTAVCDTPTAAAVADAQQQLAATRSAWRRSEAVWVGPVMDRRSWALVDWPVETEAIEALLADESVGPLDGDYLSTSVSAGVRGLGAIEYVLFDADAIGALADERRCEYLSGLTEVIATESATVLSVWTTGDAEGVAYRDELAGGTDRMSASDSIDELVNSMLTRLEGSVNRELGKALGLGSGEADASGIVEGPGGFGVDDQRARAAGIRAVLLGPDGSSGLAPLLDDDLRTRLTQQFDALDAALDHLVPPLVAAVESDRAAVEAVHDAYAELRVTVSTELVSALGVTVSFSDADGDSAG
ncbi:MAG: imelysin family protein [Actinobacteria bacterium]|nr:imelysin family protein [Actinomycetota bacterium]